MMLGSILYVFTVAGCASLENATPAIQQSLADGQTVADTVTVLGSPTASVYYGAASTLINAILGINQILMGRRESRLGKILRGIDTAPGSPSVISQLAESIGLTEKDRELIHKMLKA